jgi:pyruvate, water dikinase
MKSLVGVCVCPGKVKGKVKFYKAGLKYTKRDIVILNEWITSNAAVLKTVGGLLSAQGGLTCHASIIAREYDIPCLVAVKDLDRLEEGQVILIDATNEEIKIL